MAYAVQYDVPATKEFYSTVKAEIGDEQPDGLVVHLVVKHDAGLRHIGVWDSREDWERFRRERVEPALGKVFAAAGFDRRPPRPEEHEMDVVDVSMGQPVSRR